MPTMTSVGTRYRIEISGWDMNENFFVEKTDLEWSEAEKKVWVQHALRKHDLVFVRLLGESKKASTYPLAYEVVDALYLREDNVYETLLTQIHPRADAEMGNAN